MTADLAKVACGRQQPGPVGPAVSSFDQHYTVPNTNQDIGIMRQGYTCRILLSRCSGPRVF
jgi:hypothetical protein